MRVFESENIIMKQSEIGDILDTLNQIVDNAENDLGVFCPEWMLLDVIAAAGQDSNLTIRTCCRRDLNSCGLTSNRFLVINNRCVLTCYQKSGTGRKYKQKSFRKNPGQNTFSRGYQNAVLECVELINE